VPGSAFFARALVHSSLGEPYGAAGCHEEADKDGGYGLFHFPHLFLFIFCVSATVKYKPFFWQNYGRVVNYLQIVQKTILS